MELLINDSDGIYIPQTFAEIYDIAENFENYDEIKNDLELLKDGPNLGRCFE